MEPNDFLQRQNNINRSNNGYRPHPRKNPGIHYLVYPALALSTLWFSADTLLKHRISEVSFAWPSFITEQFTTKSIPAQPTASVSNIPEVVLFADHQGHFRGTALINGVPMPFMIDTGATKTMIPRKMARSAGLPFGALTATNTAGGKVSDRLTKIDSLQIGNAEIRNLDANISDYLTEVLIGMNALKYFRTTQDGKSMSLVGQSGVRLAGLSYGGPGALTSERQTKKPTTIKKTVICDEHKVCRTIYSDH